MLNTSMRPLLVRLVSFTFVCNLCGAETAGDVHNVLTEILNPRHYNKRTRGVTDQTKPLYVNASLMFLAIEHFSEVDEVMETMGVLFLHWIDERLTWDPVRYNDTRHVHVFQGDIWRPEASLANPSKAVTLLGDERILMKVSYTGHVLWYAGSIFKTACSVNVKAYPWDKQHCEIEFIVWGFEPSEVVLRGAERPIDMGLYRENGQWSIISTDTRQEDRKVVSAIVFSFELKRRALFDVVIVIIPTVTFSMLNLLVFFLPIQSGERMSYALTVLLSTAVMLTFTSDHLPKNAETMAAICYFIAAVLVKSTVICACTVLSLYLYHKTDDGGMPPLWATRLVRALRGNRRRGEYNTGTTCQGIGVNDTTGDIVPNITTNNGRVDSDGTGLDNNQDIGWADVSQLFDHTCFAVTLSWLVAILIIYVAVVVSQ